MSSGTQDAKFIVDDFQGCCCALLDLLCYVVDSYSHILYEPSPEESTDMCGYQTTGHENTQSGTAGDSGALS